MIRNCWRFSNRFKIGLFHNLRKYPFGNFKSDCETSLKNIFKIKIPNDGAFGGENKLKEGFSSSEMGFVISGLRDFLAGLIGTTKFNSGTRSSEILIFGTVTERLVLHGLAKKWHCPNVAEMWNLHKIHFSIYPSPKIFEHLHKND